jgi:hypothetical protein
MAINTARMKAKVSLFPMAAPAESIDWLLVSMLLGIALKTPKVKQGKTR